MRRKYAYWSLVLLFLYYNVDRWIPLGNWNGERRWPVHNEQFWLDIIVGTALLITILSFRHSFLPGTLLGTALLGLWIYFHLQSWWLPYLFGVTNPRAIAFHAQFLENSQVLPKFGNHFPPDAEHTFIDVFVFAAFFSCLTTTIRHLYRKSSRASVSPAKGPHPVK